MTRAKSKQTKDRQRKQAYLDLKTQARQAKSIINESAYNDALHHERVARTTTGEVISELSKQFPDGVLIGAVPEVEDGLVLSNDYGQGIFNI